MPASANKSKSKKLSARMPAREKPKAKPKPKGKGKGKGKSATTPMRLIARIVSVALFLVVVALCVAGDFYVHHPNDWLNQHRSVFTAPLEYLGNRTAFFTDALGWTGHDCVYESDDPAPTGEILFAGAPVRQKAPAPADIVTLNRGDFLIGWSPSLRHPVWAAYHVPREARFPYSRKGSFSKDRSVESCPSPSAYTNLSYDRGHMVPCRAISTRFGDDMQKKTFLMTNVAPQRRSLNCGPWREMEHRICDLWSQKYGEVWVIVGAIPNPSPASREKLADSSVVVPEKFYMVITAQNEDGVRALAVLFEQSAGRWDFPLHNIVTLSELENLTGLEFFPDMPKFLKSPLKRDRPTRLWPIRFIDLVKLLMIRFT